MLINYFNNASTTTVDSRILEAMLPYFDAIYSNSASNHDFGKYSKQAIELLRKQVLECMVIKTKHIYSN